MNPTPECMEAIKRHRRLVETLGMDHPDTMRAMMLSMVGRLIVVTTGMGMGRGARKVKRLSSLDRSATSFRSGAKLGGGG